MVKIMKLKTSKLICIKKRVSKECNFCSERNLRQIWSGSDKVTGEKDKIYLRDTYVFLNRVIIGITEQIIKPNY